MIYNQIVTWTAFAILEMFYLKIVIYRNQMFEMKRDTKILEILIASYDHSTKARPTLSLLW